MVGAAGFEPATFCSQSRRATRLRYAPFQGSNLSARPGPPPLSRPLCEQSVSRLGYASPRNPASGPRSPRRSSRCVRPPDGRSGTHPKAAALPSCAMPRSKGPTLAPVRGRRHSRVRFASSLFLGSVCLAKKPGLGPAPFGVRPAASVHRTDGRGSPQSRRATKLRYAPPVRIVPAGKTARIIHVAGPRSKLIVPRVDPVRESALFPATVDG